MIAVDPTPTDSPTDTPSPSESVTATPSPSVTVTTTTATATVTASPSPAASFDQVPDGAAPVAVVAVGGPAVYLAEIGFAGICLCVMLLAVLVIRSMRGRS